MFRTPRRRFAAALDDKIAWLTNDALPLWARRGVDPHGGFFERIDQSGNPATDLARRARVVARQTYVFATATKQGWGDYASLAAHGYAEVNARCLLQDGLSLRTYAPDGAQRECAFDGYDQAFVLFALATIASTVVNLRAEASAAGERLLAEMQARFRHPDIGFEEAMPRQTPLLQNPHMHLLEACLAFDAVSDAASVWRLQAEELVMLARTRLANQASGAVHEYFDGDWRPIIDAEGGWIEPGHQFEWAWLLWQWGDRTGDAQALAMAESLYRIGTDHGLAMSGQVIDALAADYTPRARSTRLWPQTERLKACIAAAEHATGAARNAALDSATESLDALTPYFATPVPGLWFDRLDAAGNPTKDAAPASSLYHIVCALDYAQRYEARLLSSDS